MHSIATVQLIYLQPSWDSLDSRTIPKWYQNAKLGIFCHWGVYAVPAYRWKSNPIIISLVKKKTFYWQCLNFQCSVVCCRNSSLQSLASLCLQIVQKILVYNYYFSDIQAFHRQKVGEGECWGFMIGKIDWTGWLATTNKLEKRGFSSVSLLSLVSNSCRS